MSESLFEVAGDGYVPTELAVGPWSASALHGGPVAALLAAHLEQQPTDVPMFPARLTVELLRPVGLEALGIAARTVRSGRKVQVLEAVLYTLPADGPADDRVVARATLQQIRVASLPLSHFAAAANGPAESPPPPEELPQAPGFLPGEGRRFHNAAVEHRIRGRFLSDPGPALDWIRLVVDLLPDQPASPFARVAAAADFGNGVSAVVPFGTHLFVNPDLTIHLHRLPVDEWVCIDAITHIGDEGVGFAESAVHDRQGRIGRAVQSLLLDVVR